MTTQRTSKKLIEVALPLEAINEAAAKEKSIRHGHPSTMHLWWARRPLAAARAVIFSQMVDDPSEYLDDPKEEEHERNRLFGLIEELVQWDNSTNEQLLERARAEIRRSWIRHCLGKESARILSDLEIKAKLDSGEVEPVPAFHDPFAGGGSLPLEAQRLGLEAFASDLNPVAVLINKAMVELPAMFSGLAPIHPGASECTLKVHTWRGSEGLVEDILYYGQWMHEQAVSRIGWLYPDILVTDELANLDSHLSDYRGKKLTVVAWIWARTVKSPNPAFSHVLVPLASTFVLSSRKGKEVWLEPTVDGDSYGFKVRYGRIPESANDGTKLGRGANFQCILSGTPLEPDYIKREGTAGRMGVRLLAVVCDGGRGRVYIEPSNEQEKMAFQARPEWKPEQELNYDPRAIWTPAYGLKRYCDLFTDRQLTALGCFAGLVAEVHDRILKDCARHARSEDFRMSSDEQQRAYAAAVATYLGLTVSRLSNSMNALAVWSQSREQSVNLFSRQAIPMAWDFPEVNPFSGAAGDFLLSVRNVCKCIPSTHTQGWSSQADASTQRISETKVISTDPPYYDNVGYADLSDFFYVWQRKCLRSVYPDLFSTMTVPKAEELVAAPYRHGGKFAAEDFFLTGMTAAMENIVKHCNGAFPITIYYAFRQSESRSDGLSSTGWETFLEAVLNAGLALHGTWPMRTERPTGVKHAVNALASSIVLVCVKRATTAGMTTRRDFQSQLRKEMPVALRNLQHGNIAPVDMAQSSIGPGMAIFSRYNKVVEADGSPMKVRTALALINEALDEILAEQEGELDACSRWAVAWFSDYGTGEGPFGRADDLSRAKNTSVDGLQRAGIVYAKAGKVNLLRREELDADWDPAADARLTVWESAQHLIRTLEITGEAAAANLLTKLGGLADQARDLAYRLYNTCERKGWAEEARSYNGLVIAWPELVRLAAQEPARPKMAQGELAYEEE